MATDRLKAFISLLQYYGFSAGSGKAWFLIFASVFAFIAVMAFSGCRPSTSTDKSPPLRILLDRPPTTLNPRMSLDSNGQRLGELLFSALTIKDTEMRPRPALAESWEILDQGLIWKFKIKEGLKDHDGQSINAERLAACFEEYRNGNPRSPLIGSFQSLKSIEASYNAHGSELIFKLDRPDPYLATNLTLFRYFTTGDPSKPCREPKPGDHIIGSGPYRMPRFGYDELTPEQAIDLVPVEESLRSLRFIWALDDNTKALKLLRGDVDAAWISLSLSKTHWIQKNYGDRFRVISRPNGVNVSYLAFNMKHPALKKLEVRKAISLALNREDFAQNKLFGLGTPATTLLSPLLEESAPQTLAYDPAQAERLLDQAGFPRGRDGIRMKLRFKTTSVRDGFETAVTLQNMLRAIGIELTLDVVEPAVFFASVRKGAFELYSSRWIGISDASILHRTLKTGHSDNRGSYSNVEIDALLDLAGKESDSTRRKAILAKIQAKVAEDLPFLPLWYWDPAVILRKDLTGLEASQLSLSGSLAPLRYLR